MSTFPSSRSSPSPGVSTLGHAEATPARAVAPGRVRLARGAAPLGLGIIVLAYAALAVGYVTRTPIWQNPDEPAHYNYVAQVAETGTLPTLQMGDWDTQLLDRLKTGRLEPGDAVSSIRYEGWQPPLLYLLAAPVFRIGLGAPADQQLQHLRLLDACLGGLTLLVAYAAARQVLPVGLALAVPLAMAGVPMFTAVSAGLSADPLANLLAAILVLVLLRALRQPALDWRWALGTGVLIGLGMLAKLALATFVPLALALLAVRSPRRAQDASVLVGSLGVVLLPWLVHQVSSYGWTDPLATQRHAAVVFDQPRFPGLSVAYVTAFAQVSFHSFWAQFGWMAIPAPEAVYRIWGLLTLAALGGLVRQLDLLRQPAWLLLLAVAVLAGLAYVAYNLMFQQFQGRYLFTALVPLAMLLVVGWAAWLPTRMRAGGTLLLGAGLLALNAYALVRVLGPGFAAPT